MMVSRRSLASLVPLLLAFATGSLRAQTPPVAKPNPKRTPGAVLTRDTAKTCHAGYAASIRPNEKTWRALRKQVAARYGVDWRATGYQMDHLIPLTLSGASTVENLWLQPIHVPMGAISKDSVDGRYLYNLVCRWHRMSLDSAQRLMQSPNGWVILWRQYHHESAKLRRLLQPEREP